MSKKFTLAVPSHFRFAPSFGITHSHFCEGLHMAFLTGENDRQ